jgi:hypothetical protein
MKNNTEIAFHKLNIVFETIMWSKWVQYCESVKLYRSKIVSFLQLFIAMPNCSENIFVFPKISFRWPACLWQHLFSKTLKFHFFEKWLLKNISYPQMFFCFAKQTWFFAWIYYTEVAKFWTKKFTLNFESLIEIDNLITRLRLNFFFNITI